MKGVGGDNLTHRDLKLGSGSRCRRRCRSPSPDAHDDEGRRFEEGDHAENGRTDGRSDIKLLEIITGNNYFSIFNVNY